MALQEELVPQILNEFVSTSKCSFQIGYKYKVNSRQVRFLIERSLGKEFFKDKENLALSSLEQNIRRDLVKESISYSELSRKYEINVNSLMRLLQKGTSSADQSGKSHETSYKPEIIEITPTKLNDTQLTASIEPTHAVQATNVTVSVTNPAPLPEVNHELQVQCPSKLNTVNIAFNGNNISYQTSLPIEESVAKVLKSLAV